MVTRFVERYTSRGYVGASRLAGNGMQLFWLTESGREFLVRKGATRADDLFPARGPVSLKDLHHTLAVVSVGLALSRRFPQARMIRPSWAVQRAFDGKLEAIPDVLCVCDSPQFVVAVEVDLGTEPLELFATKCQRLAALLADYGSAVIITVLTTTDRRIERLLARVVESCPPSVSISAHRLSRDIGKGALPTFDAIFGVPVGKMNR
jgi:hypothetical protein